MSPQITKKIAVLSFVLLGTSLPLSAFAWQPLQNCGGGVYSRWPAGDIPVDYAINPNGSGIAAGTTISIIEDCFGYWYEPCCSGAQSSSSGSTSRSALSNGDGNNVIGFASGSWPAEFGSPSTTLGVTPALIGMGCQIVEADIIFNTATHDFCYSGCGGWDTAFEPVATHEIGHLFGLGHSSDSDALMYYAYTGGVDGRPGPDDIEGICTIYPDDHCGCDGPEDCDPPSECVDGECVVPDPCDGVTCDPGEECVGGECVTIGDCPICAPCEDNSPCGANGQCINRGDGQTRCIQFCGTTGSCPGDSVCFEAEAGGETFYLCLNPDAGDTGQICPNSYTCTDCTATGCDPGEQCFDGGCRLEPTDAICAPTNDACSTCPEAAEGCVRLEDGRFVCSVRCYEHSDCGPCGRCVDIGDPRTMICLNNDIEDVGACPDGWTCTPQTDGDSDSDADADADADTDADTDADSDADGDASTDDDSGSTPPSASDPRCDCSMSSDGEKTPMVFLLVLVALAYRSLRRSRSK